jgi:hypothetical protein
LRVHTQRFEDCGAVVVGLGVAGVEPDRLIKHVQGFAKAAAGHEAARGGVTQLGRCLVHEQMPEQGITSV